MAIITQATGHTRNGILSLIILFVIGFLCLTRVDDTNHKASVIKNKEIES